MKRVRLIKVIVQPILVIDDTDADELQEFGQEPVVVPASEWATYSGARFRLELDAFEKALNTAPDAK